MSPIVNPANAITASRFAALWPFAHFMSTGQYQWAGIMVILCAFGDVIDGKVAKLLECTSSFGELFDAIADAICYGFFFIYLAVEGFVPRVPAFAILGMGAANTVMRAIYARRAGRATNYQSWAMERIVGFAAYLCGFGVVGYEVEFFYNSCAIVMAVVLIHDTKRMLVDPVPA